MPVAALADEKETPAVHEARILVVDDEPLIREFLEETLRRRGHQVTLANSGDEALRRRMALAGPRAEGPGGIILSFRGARPGAAFRRSSGTRITGSGWGGSRPAG